MFDFLFKIDNICALWCYVFVMSDLILVIIPHSIAGRLIVKSLADGFEQNGFSVDFYDEMTQNNFSEFIKDKDYKYITGYDFSPLKLKVDNKLKMPCICYFADVIESKAAGVGEDFDKYIPFLNEKDVYTFYWDKELAKQADYKNLFYMPMFVNTEVYKPMDIEKEYDIMFAGRLDTDYRLEMTIDLMKMFSNLNFAWFAIEKHYIDALSRTDEKELLKKAYKGFIDNEPDMAKEINKSKIIYTINSQGLTSLNHRTIQTVACKTLVISDFREEINMYKGDLPFYIDIQDLAEKIKYYSENKKAYEYTTDKCYQFAINNLSAKICVEKMLDRIVSCIS